MCALRYSSPRARRYLRYALCGLIGVGSLAASYEIRRCWANDSARDYYSDRNAANRASDRAIAAGLGTWDNTNAALQHQSQPFFKGGVFMGLIRDLMNYFGWGDHADIGPRPSGYGYTRYGGD